jgi:hypothetical protein
VADRVREALAHVNDCSGRPSNVLHRDAVIQVFSLSDASRSWRCVFAGHNRYSSGEIPNSVLVETA